MIYLTLFLTFLKIGAISFGGGYAMISFIREECLLHNWLSEEELLNMIAISESTPGPIAVNMATFIGSSQGGMLGAFIATFGVILPAFFIILLITSLLTSFVKYPAVNSFIKGVNPAICGLIIATSTTMLINQLFSFNNSAPLEINYYSLFILVIIIIIDLIYTHIKKKQMSPIILILISGIIGIIIFA